MGFYRRLDEGIPNRLGADVDEYDGWVMVNIIAKFATEDLTDTNIRIKFRKALLVSYECNQLAKRERFYV